MANTYRYRPVKLKSILSDDTLSGRKEAYISVAVCSSSCNSGDNISGGKVTSKGNRISVVVHLSEGRHGRLMPHLDRAGSFKSNLFQGC